MSLKEKFSLTLSSLNSFCGRWWSLLAVSLLVVAVAFLSFQAGKYRNIYPFRLVFGDERPSPPEPPWFKHRKDHSGSTHKVEGCKLYPDEKICKRLNQPWNELGVMNADSCFAQQGEKIDLDQLPMLPSECTSFGPLGFISLNELQGEPEIKVAAQGNIPPEIAPYVVERQPGLNLTTTFLTIALIVQVNEASLSEFLEEDLSDSPELGEFLGRTISATAVTLTEDERRVVGQMLSYYNTVVRFREDKIAEVKTGIREECQAYAGRDIVPIRCILL